MSTMSVIEYEVNIDGAERMAFALLAQACKDAAGRGPDAVDARAFLLSPASARWARLVGLEQWPPTGRQLAAAKAAAWRPVGGVF